MTTERKAGPGQVAPTSTFELDRGSPVPLHLQAELRLRHILAEPRYQKGELLPDELSLAKQLGISRNTLRAAISRLVQEGLLERRPGVGTRVFQERTSSGLSTWLSFTREMARQGIQVQTFEVVAERLRATAEVAAALQIQRESSVLRLDRLRGWNGLPAVHFRSYLHPRLGLEPRDDFERPLYELIAERSKVLPERSQQELLAVEAEPWVAERLMVPPGSPVLVRRHRVYDRLGKPLEYAIDTIRSDRFTLTLTMTSEDR